MTASPLVSVVLPTYNRARDLERALNSVLAQSYSSWEAVVIDNHSNDDTEDVVARLDDRRITLHKIHNEGVIAKSRNMGMAHARGEYVAFLDSDDWWTPNKLEESVTRLAAGADVVYHDLFLVKRPNQRRFWRTARTRSLRRPVFEDLIANGNGLTNSSVVVRASLLRAIGGLSEDRALIATEDFDAWLRIAAISDRFERIPSTLGYYWAGGGTTSNPERVLETIDAIETRYASALSSVRASGGGGWIEYGRAKAHYRLGANDRALKSLVQLRRSELPLSIRAKAVGLRLMIALRRIRDGTAQRR